MKKIGTPSGSRISKEGRPNGWSSSDELTMVTPADVRLDFKPRMLFEEREGKVSNGAWLSVVASIDLSGTYYCFS